MSIMTIRGIDNRITKVLKEKAKEEGVSIDVVLVKILKEALGIEKKTKSITHNDLDYLAGTWSEKDYKEFQSKVADFERVDENMWSGNRD